MTKDHNTSKGQRSETTPRDEARARQSAKEGPAAYAPTTEEAKKAEDVTLSPAAPGDDRTPDKTIGQIKYADKSGKRDGGAGEKQTSELEPEKQGGIGGP